MTTDREPDTAFAANMKAAMRDRVTSILDSYIQEAEHQDGIGYWQEYFTHPEQAVEDFAKYLVGVLETETDEQE